MAFRENKLDIAAIDNHARLCQHFADCRLNIPEDATREMYEAALVREQITNVAAIPTTWTLQEQQATTLLLNRFNRPLI